MHKIERTLDIKAAPQRIYEFLVQPPNLLSIWPNLVSVSNVLQGKGGANDFDWVFKMAGVQMKGHATVEEAQPARLLRYRNKSGIPSTFIWTFAGLDGSGTRLGLTVEYDMPRNVIGRITEAIVAKINERDLDTMLGNLKDVMEQAQPGAGVSAGAPAH
jgi:uncharacterized membrane protein